MTEKRGQNEFEKQSIFIFIAVCVLIGIILIGASFFFIKNSGSTPETSSTQQTITEEDGKQILNLTAKGGYSPKKITAQAGKPAILKVKTASTFDCSTALVIPTLKVTKSLPATGVTSIEIPAQTAGSEIKGTCSMGMYSFSITFN
jgi:uncharacterized protein